MPGLPGCQRCPLRDSELNCPTITNGFSFCNKIDPCLPTYDSRFARSVLMIARGEKQVFRPREEVGAITQIEPAPHIEYPSLTVQPALLSVSQSLAFHAEAKECPHRSRDVGCGCSGNRCAAGKGRNGLVNDWDCLKCLAYVDEAGAPTRKGLPVITEPTLEPSSSNCGS